jgi:two-component system, sensor histidine kinase YesM
MIHASGKIGKFVFVVILDPYSFDVEEEELLSCLVPKLILQPLAENSVMHGSSDDGSVMEILITCWEENNHLIIELCDNGKGFEVTPAALEPHTNRKKIGITNVNDRMFCCKSDPADHC